MIKNNPFSLEGKTILVTGASSGIGKATAIECSRMGAKVVASARNRERLQETFDSLCQEFGHHHQMILSDLSIESDIDELIDMVPSLDGMSLNAGIVKTLPIKFIKDSDLMEVMTTNTFSALKLTQKLLNKKKVNRNASIVFTSSIGGVYTVTMGNTMYSMSKGALNAFMKQLALEYASKGIRSNSVNPGMIETKILEAGIISSEEIKKNMELYPLGRHGRPEEVAYAIIYLLSDASSFITGQDIVIDGGYTLR